MTGRRGALTAAITGFLVPFLVIFLLSILPFLTQNAMRGVSAWGENQATIIAGHLTMAGWIGVFENSLLLGLCGLLVAMTIWYIAYTKH